MSLFSTRRALVLASASLPFALSSIAREARAADRQGAGSAMTQLEQLEEAFGGRIGLFAHDLATGAQLRHRADQRFPLCSTFKLMAASAVLARSMQVQGLLQERQRYGKADLVTYSPVTEKHVGDGMTVAELCAAAMQYSDNTAGNLLIRLLGGPEAVTAFARSIGDTAFRLDRWETALNTAIPGDPRDTTTPEAMGRSLQRLTLGSVLGPAQREQLQEWLRGNTTGNARIRAGVPAGWTVGDKTGTGDYGTANDVAVLWRPQREPVVLAIYTAQDRKDAQARNDVIASAARIAAGWIERA
jgi:beta-lactamase class A